MHKFLSGDISSAVGTIQNGWPSIRLNLSDLPLVFNQVWQKGNYGFST
jgi:hypothetical protein